MSSYNAARSAVPLAATGHAAPTESRLAAWLVDCFNAEVVASSVGTVDEASRGFQRRTTISVYSARHGPGERIDRDRKRVVVSCLLRDGHQLRLHTCKVNVEAVDALLTRYHVHPALRKMFPVDFRHSAPRPHHRVELVFILHTTTSTAADSSICTGVPHHHLTLHTQ